MKKSNTVVSDIFDDFIGRQNINIQDIPPYIFKMMKDMFFSGFHAALNDLPDYFPPDDDIQEEGKIMMQIRDEISGYVSSRNKENEELRVKHQQEIQSKMKFSEKVKMSANKKEE